MATSHLDHAGCNGALGVCKLVSSCPCLWGLNFSRVENVSFLKVWLLQHLLVVDCATAP